MTDQPLRKFTPEDFTAERWEAEHLQAALKSEEWSKRLLTSLAVGNAAGLAAIASTLPDVSEPAVWQIHTAQAFALGIACAGLAMLFRERFWAAKAYRYAWLAREPERFPDDIKALVIWKARPWWKKPFRPQSPVEGVDPNHPAMKIHWQSERWNTFGEVGSVLSALAFFVALTLALWIR